jgi:uncharacterized protein (DUF885 family)
MMSLSYDQFTQDFHSHFTSDPNQCVHLGIDKHLNDLPNATMEYQELETKRAKELLAAVPTLEQSGFSFDQLLDLDLAALMLERQIHDAAYTFNGSPQARQLPSGSDAISGGIFLMFINDPRPPEERLENILHRIEQVPRYLEQLKGRLEIPVKRWVQMDQEKMRELPHFFATLCQWAQAENWSGAAPLAKSVEIANQSCADYIDTLNHVATTESFHVGAQTANDIVRLRGIDLSLGEIHQIASDFLRKTNATIEGLRQKLIQKYALPDSTTVERLQAFLNQKFRIPVRVNLEEDILGRYEQEKQNILRFITSKNLFPILPNQDMMILNTPDFMRPSIPAGAMVSPPPFREGVRTSLIYLTLSEELRDEHTELSIPTMMIHEGIPGHHLQLATASTHKSIIRKHVNAMDQAEGWTTMLEDYMLDQNYLSDHTDETRFCAKRDISRIGARVAIDLFFMSGDKSYLNVGVPVDLESDDPFECAGNLLREVTGFTPGRVQAELNWYSQERGYPLSYLTGNHLVWSLKKDYEAATSSDLSSTERDHQFHRTFLNAGSMPVRFLRQVFANENLLLTDP